MRFPFFRNRDSVKNGILISIRRTGDGFHPGLFSICARAFSGGRKVVVIFDLFKRMQEQSKADLAILTYHAAKSLGIAALYISEDLDENYGAYDLIYKYRPEKKEFSIIDYRA